ncbi:MAG: hypothetical protein JW762_13640, partial [Dehalococcoidales bacterium]|nr:hypothetical protein [Dehalococcoidales bacterium]
YSAIPGNSLLQLRGILFAIPSLFIMQQAIFESDTLGWLTLEPQLSIFGTFVGDYFTLEDYEAVGLFNDQIFVFPFTTTTLCPVDIRITDPEGLVLSKISNEIQDGRYSELDLNGDGELDDQIVILERKCGDYKIQVIPEPQASPDDTYSLKAVIEGTRLILADEVQISEIPIEGYYIRFDGNDGFQIIPANIDIDPNTLNLKSEGKVITTYIELPIGYDVSQIDISTIMLNDQVSALMRPTNIGDCDKDGIPDLMVKFDRGLVQENLEIGEIIEVRISGEVDGIIFEGTDTIRVIE